ncbi:MAG TPA: TerC family protein [Syntrophales bacterium]|nr:TerC family protein [Syntrophales bacterium]HOU77279.1 TerC family protein [Syntrophales bacterium]HPC32709.1 TerC family protein [Syntrophales bacterium]HQG34230.1 TerC family protein [Syntrophales bacterium]HQJ29656.1 TerC family protein [Syntrophales bacterium]
MEIIGWLVFAVLFMVMICLDLFVAHRKDKEIDIRDALKWTGFWVSLALAFGAGIYYFEGQTKALEFFAGYLLEYSLSVDNLFVFLMIFSYFSVPGPYQHKALLWGIVGALIMRAVFIAAGVALVTKFHWVIYIFGAFLIYTAVKMARGHDKDIHPENNPALRLLHKVIPVTSDYGNGKFFVRINGVLHATPLFAVILVIEPTDLMFAIDSIPAILAITTDPFIVYTSNVFAIMGLRSLFFALAGLMRLFRYIRHGLVVILMFVGIKMLLQDLCHIPIGWSLGFIAGTLLLAVIASVLHPEEIPAVVKPEGEK